MKKQLLLLLGALIALPAMARDFTYTYEGKTITYTVLDEAAKTCATTAYNHNSWDDIILPEHPKDGETEYTLIEIGNMTFSGRNLTSVTIPNSVTTIGNTAFSGCNRLTSVNIPNSVTTIGSSAFGGCGWLTSVTIPNSVTTIGNMAFSNCYHLTSVALGNSVTRIGRGAFSGCSSLTNLVFNAEKCTYCGSYDTPAFPSNIERLTIGSNVTILPDYVFKGCSGVTSVTIPNSVTSIGSSAFYGCSGLTSVIFGNSVTTTGENVFYNCDNLRKGAYPSNIANPFPDNCLAISYDAVDSRIEEGFVYSRRKNKLYFVPLEVGPHFTVPESVTEITDNAFYGCTELKDIILPKDLSTLGEYVWKECTAIDNIVYTGAEPIAAQTNIFDRTVYDNATLYVGKGKRELFQASDPWGFFYNISEEEYSGIEEDGLEFNASAAENAGYIYTLQWRRVSADRLRSGIYIVGGRKVFIKQ